MAQRARLDYDLVYWGPEEVDALGPDDVAAPDDVIRPGAYRWQPATADDCGHWVPLPASQVKKAPGAPSLEQAFHDLVTAGPDAPRVKAWVKAFEGTIEGGVG